MPELLQPETEATVEQATPENFCDTTTAKNLWTIVDHLDRMDRFMRDKLVKKWRKQMCYWDNVQYVWWSEFAHDWRTPEQASEEDLQADIDPALYAKVVNIYRAHGEVIIAAMSASLPSVPFMPDDADNADDVATAKAYTKIGTLIQKHNYAELLFMKALYILYNQGVVFGYNENVPDKKYGVVERPVQIDHTITSRDLYCPNCGFQVGNEEVSAVPVNPEEVPEELRDEAPIGAPAELPEENVLPANNLPPLEETCPSCGTAMVPESEEYQEVFPRTVGYEEVPKSRERIEVYGPLNVKTAPWATKSADLPYLILETEEHFAKLQDIYPEIAEKIVPATDTDSYDRAMRTNVQFQGETNDLCTVKRCWLRPWAYNILGNRPEASKGIENDDIMELREKYPNGVYCVIINRDLVVEAVEDILDDHWTWTEHPLAETIHAEPVGAGVMPIQDMTNEMFNLTLESIEFGIPEIFADPNVLNFDAYGKSEARPGQISAATPYAGRSLGEAFFEVKTSSISQEIDRFANRLERVGQFVSGALPTVFGGAIQGGTGTAREYEMSRAQALQRLQITWKLVKIWWAKLLSKAVRSFADNMMEDERYVAKRGSSFVNVWIRKASMGGKVGEVEPDVNESFPISWAQKRDVILQMIQQGNEDIMAVIRHPENAGLIASIIGLPELFVPGDDDRNKQLIEIAELIQSEPIEMMPPMGPEGPPMGPDGQPPMMQPMMQSTVQVDPELDNHIVESETCKAWLISEVGLQFKRENPGAYMNVLLHFKEHKMHAMAMMAPQEESNGEETSSERSDSGE